MMWSFVAASYKPQSVVRKQLSSFHTALQTANRISGQSALIVITACKQSAILPLWK
jgi:hypothetical protein